MFKKIMISGLTAATLAIGLGATTAPANAQVFFGLGMGGPGYHHCGYYGCGYGPGYGFGPGYGYGWNRHRHNCWWQTVRRHHHWVQVRRCG